MELNHLQAKWHPDHLIIYKALSGKSYQLIDPGVMLVYCSNQLRQMTYLGHHQLLQHIVCLNVNIHPGLNAFLKVYSYFSQQIQRRTHCLQASQIGFPF